MKTHPTLPGKSQLIKDAAQNSQRYVFAICGDGFVSLGTCCK